jgi:hypothetical protein
MMLRRLQATPVPWERKKFAGPLDIRAPEDHLVPEQERTRNQPIWSVAIGKALEELNFAARGQIESEMKRVAKGVVDATSSYFRMSGVPAFAHDPVPPQLIRDALPVEHLEPGDVMEHAVDRFVDLFDESIRPSLRNQVIKQLHDAIDSKLQLGRKGAIEHDGNSESAWQLPPHERDEGDDLFETPNRGAMGVFGRQILGKESLADDAAESRFGIRQDAGQPRNWLSGDVLSQFAVSDGGQTPLGGRRTAIQTFDTDPSGQDRLESLSHKKRGDRSPIQQASILRGFTLLFELGKRAAGKGKKIIETQLGRAATGGSLSVLAEWAANRNKPKAEQPTNWDYALAFASGAATGVINPKWGKAEIDAGIAIGSSLASDFASNREMSVPGALGAGLAAYVVSKASEVLDSAELRLLSQSAAKLGRKFGEKYFKEFVKNMLGQVQLAVDELKELWDSFERHIQEELQGSY